jgi:hypothetical protein
VLKKVLIITIACYCIFANARAQCLHCSSDNSFVFLIERDGLRYYVFDETNSFDPAFFAVKVNEYKKRPWYENEAVQRAIQESRDIDETEKAKAQEIPQPLKDYGFTEEAFKGYQRKADKEYFIFYNWMTQEPDDLITFVVEGN